jgi:hypothetical protein
VRKTQNTPFSTARVSCHGRPRPPKPQKLVIIGGCGHVGLPSIVNSGHIPFMEKSAEEQLRAVIGKTLAARQMYPLIQFHKPGL